MMNAFEPGEYTEATAANADPGNWEWNMAFAAEAGWEPAEDSWQQFSVNWYGVTDKTSPYISLEPLIPYLNEFPSSILVRECYLELFKLVWGAAMSSEGMLGTIITGQPGTGKSLCQLYFLVQLLQRRQVVLFTLDGDRLYLFYHGKVSTTSVASLAKAQPGRQLPKRKRWSSNVFIWSLFDIEQKREPASLLVSPPCLPIQTASPDSCRFEIWDNKYAPMHAGMPLWTREELAQGLRFHHQYNSLLVALRKFCENPQYEPDPLLPFPGARALLDELQPEPVLPSAKEALGEVQQDTVPLSVEEAVDHLLGAAIERFGYSARDVFSAVFNYESVTRRHQSTFSTHAELIAAIFALANNETSTRALHRILTLSPVYSEPYIDPQWSVGFKSDWVAMCAIQALGVVETAEIRRIIEHLRRIPQASKMVRYFLEPLAHRLLSRSDKTWPFFSMASDGTDSPRFVTDKDIPGGIRFKNREVKIVSIADLKDLDNGIYYVPETPNLPLLDSFLVDIDHPRRSAVLSVLQVTTSRSHGGPASGYQNIRSIVGSLKEQLREEPSDKKKKTATERNAPRPSVEVRYFLVVPKGGSKNLEWHFPKGWNKNFKNDHRGEVYCVEINLT